MDIKPTVVSNALRKSKASENQAAVCCHCNEAFYVCDIKGGFLDRSCPHCGEPLSEEIYDAAAIEARDMWHIAEKSLEDISKKEADLREFLESKAKRWRIISRFVAKRKLNKLAPLVEAAHDEEVRARNKFMALANSRYYAGEWFLLSNIPLSQSGRGDKWLYSLYADYDGPGGTFSINHPSTPKGKGIIGEFLVFETLRKEIVAPNSRLAGARLLPNLCFPICQEGSDEECCCEVDLILATRGCAFVIETKNTSREITTRAPYEEVCIKSHNPKKHKKYRGFHTNVLKQNAGHARSFLNACDWYGPSSVYEVSLFVEPAGFESNFNGFYENVLVSAMPQKSETIIDALALETYKHDEIMSQDRLNVFATYMIGRFGNLSPNHDVSPAMRITKMSA